MECPIAIEAQGKWDWSRAKSVEQLSRLTEYVYHLAFAINAARQNIPKFFDNRVLHKPDFTPVFFADAARACGFLVTLKF